MATTSSFPEFYWHSSCCFHQVTSQSLTYSLNNLVSGLLYSSPPISLYLEPIDSKISHLKLGSSIRSLFLGLLLLYLLSINNFLSIPHFSPTHSLDTYTLSSTVIVINSTSEFKHFTSSPAFSLILVLLKKKIWILCLFVE